MAVDLDSPRLWLAGALLTRRGVLARRVRRRLVRHAHSHPSVFAARRKVRFKGAAAAARLCFNAAEELRMEAASSEDLRAARALYRLAMRSSKALRPLARPRLLLMLLQLGRTPSSRAVSQLLTAGGFVGILSPAVVCYARDARAAPTLPRARATASGV